MGVYTIFLDVSRSADLLMEETRALIKPQTCHKSL